MLSNPIAQCHLWVWPGPVALSSSRTRSGHGAASSCGVEFAIHMLDEKEDVNFTHTGRWDYTREIAARHRRRQIGLSGLFADCRVKLYQPHRSCLARGTMTLVQVAAALKPVIGKILRHRRPGQKGWDKQFRLWIKNARACGVDPNDLGDAAWKNDHLAEVVEDRYLKYIPPQGTVLELGPGTGRLTRKLIGRAGRIELVDYSKFVIAWMNSYLAGKVDFHAHLITAPAFPAVETVSVDIAVAHGVMEHLDPYETYSFLIEFLRVLKPGGIVSFNYDTIHSSGGAAWFRAKYPGAGRPAIFRFYTPDFMSRLAEIGGFEVVQSLISDDRLAHMILRKPNAKSFESSNGGSAAS